MHLLLWLLGISVSALLAIPSLVFATECIAGSLARKPVARVTSGSARRPVAVVIPAHDEEASIAATLRNVVRQIRPGDRLLVVADNCSDKTAEIARTAGAEVIERTDLQNRGKGFAMDFGLACLAKDPRDVVIFIDADCVLIDGTIDELSRIATTTCRPVQGCYLMTSRGQASVAEFAFMVKNLVRPRGLARLGLPCQLTGTGMAIPWSLIGRAELAHGNLVEDMKLGLDLAATGSAPLFCEQAGVRSVFPETAAGAVSQRRRWEHGHLAMLLESGRRLFTLSALRSRDHFSMLLDVLVPPLALLVLALTLSSMAGLLLAMLGMGWAPAAISTASGLLILLAVTLAWTVHGRHVLPGRVILRVPRYVLGKAWLYPNALVGRSEKAWVRTDRRRA